jgi:hypothetical protein
MIELVRRMTGLRVDIGVIRAKVEDEAPDRDETLSAEHLDDFDFGEYAC